jgi:hypothetical protein
MKNKKLIKTIVYSLLGINVVILAFIIFVAFLSNPIQKMGNTIALATTREPETFTELYFENHTELPLLIASPNEFTWYKNPNTNLYQFSFTIHNLENKDMVYKYEVYSFEDEQIIIDQGNVLIKNNQSKTITENFTLPSDALRTKVTVNLINKNQQISFWVEDKK